MIYNDPSGEFIETGWDAANVLYDGGRIVKNSVEIWVGIGVTTYGYINQKEEFIKAGQRGIQKNTRELHGAYIDGGADVVATVIPFVPAGGTKIYRYGEKATSQAQDFFKNTKLTAKVRSQMENLNDKYHSFSSAVDAYASKYGKFDKVLGERGPGKGKLHDRLTIEGELGGKDGTFEFIKDLDGEINHRLFIPKEK